MHRARHSAVTALRRPRVLILLTAALATLAVALWLPTRNDNASAHENGRDGGGQSQRDGRDGDGRDQDGRRDGDRRDGNDRQQIPPADVPTFTPPTSEPPTSEPPASPEPPATTEPTEPPVTTEPPPATTEPTTAPPTTAPPTTAPPTTAPPVAKAWAPFTDYIAGQLVTFKGVEYQVQQTHTSLPGWEPTKLPELFATL